MRVAPATLVAFASLAAAAPAQSGDPVPFTTVERSSGSSSRYTARTSFVIRTEKRWRHVWSRLHGNQFPPPRRPRVNFRRSTVIAVLRHPGTGVGIAVRAVVREAGGLRVHAVESRAGAGCVVPQVIVHPYHVIRVARTSGPVAVERSEQVRSC